ncbi:MAG TPA: potassium-transporting ATPase subunit C, partial [Acidimicrobiales bacterium]|nr:potassium-transporting ATPase subunit C [Acidimicrobiales bacterium]
MILHLRRSLLLSAIFLVLFGLAYPLAGTGLAQAFFGHQANGSLTSNGSSLIGQTWTGPKWFQGRPDGTVLTNKSGQVVVSGTNQPGPLSASLAKSVAQQAEVLKQEGIIPTNDLVTTS